MSLSEQQVGLKYGFRSGLEETVAGALKERGIGFTFEEHKVKYEQPAKTRTYTPDFWLPYKADLSLPFGKQRGFFVETKGRWLTEDRQKHQHIRKSNPDIDIRLLFSNANARISKQSATTYAAYCERSGWKFGHRYMPLDWLRELGYNLEIK